MAMIAPIKLDDLRPIGKPARYADGAHARFSPGVDHAYFLDTRHAVFHHLRHTHFRFTWDTKARAALGGRLYRLHNGRVCVP